MVIENFSKRRLNTLNKLYLSKDIINIEAEFYIYNDLKRNSLELLKIFYDDSSENMGDKSDVIGSLLQYKSWINIPELVLPDYMVSISSVMSGYAMPFIENNVNLKLLLSSKKVFLKRKLELLKEVYTILDKVMNNNNLKGNFYLVDIHENNFIIDLNCMKVKAVDIDSCYINDSTYPFSKYFASNGEMLMLPHKYPRDMRTMNYIPSNNTMLASFIFMLLNTLSGEKSYLFSREKFDNYLDELNSLGISHILLDDINTLYNSDLNVTFNIDNLNYIDCSKDYSLRKAR